MLLPADVAWLILPVRSSSDGRGDSDIYAIDLSNPTEAASGNVRREAADT
jgi:hypothetical protein